MSVDLIFLDHGESLFASFYVTVSTEVSMFLLASPPTWFLNHCQGISQNTISQYGQAAHCAIQVFEPLMEE